MVIIEWNGGALPVTSGNAITLGTGAGLLAEHLLVQHDGVAATYAEWSFAATTTIALRYYVELPSAWASSTQALAAFRNGATPSLRTSLAGTGAPGSLRMYDSTGTQQAATGTNTVSVSTLYRIEAQIDHDASQARMGVWQPGSTTPLWSSSWTAGSFLAQTTSLRVGATTGASPQLGAIKIAHVMITDDINDWIGEHDDIEGELKVAVWNGTTLIPVVGVL